MSKKELRACFVSAIEKLVANSKDIQKKDEWNKNVIKLLEGLEHIFFAFCETRLLDFKDDIDFPEPRIQFTLAVPSLGSLELLMKSYKDFSDPLIDKRLVEASVSDSIRLSVTIWIKREKN